MKYALPLIAATAAVLAGAPNALAATATAVFVSTVPELSDYLAMAFVAITGGFIVYRTYKRNSHKA
jgi:hypothetical protein